MEQTIFIENRDGVDQQSQGKSGNQSDQMDGSRG